MAEQTFVETSKPLSAQEIKQFATTAGPCITILLPAEAPGGAKRSLSQRIEKAVEKAEQQLVHRGMEHADARKLLAPILDVMQIIDPEETPGESIAIFRSNEELRHYRIQQPVDEAVVVGDNFYIRPFFGMLDGEKVFYLLALSQKDIRLLKCTEHTSEEVDLAGRIPHSLHEYMGTAKPDHVLDNRVSAGPSNGSGAKGVMFGTNTDREARDEYLSNFYKAVDRGLMDLIRNDKIPMVLCGVEYELPLYRSVNSYPHLVEEAVHGAPNGLKGGEMHARALQCLEAEREKEVATVLGQHDKQTGELARAGLKEIVKAAWDGRVGHLLVAERARAAGNLDEATHEVKAHGQPQDGDEDLINVAVMQTITHGGRVWVLPQTRMPENRPLAAVMRY